MFNTNKFWFMFFLAFAGVINIGLGLVNTKFNTFSILLGASNILGFFGVLFFPKAFGYDE